MADKTIADLTAAGSIGATDLLELQTSGGNSRKITGANAATTLHGLTTDGATVSTAQSTTSTSYTDLTTTGPSVTLTTGSSVIISIGASLVKTSAGSGNTGFIAVAVSGATTVAAADGNGAYDACETSAFGTTIARRFKLSGLNSGSNTFTLKYRCDGGTWEFKNRDIIVEAI
jgi:hypothetical protein